MESTSGGLCVGEPDFGPPPEVLEAAIQALRDGDTRYTAVTGTAEVSVRIVVTKLVSLFADISDRMFSAQGLCPPGHAPSEEHVEGHLQRSTWKA
jgi:hypothetical protein